MFLKSALTASLALNVLLVLEHERTARLVARLRREVRSLRSQLAEYDAAFTRAMKRTRSR